MTTTPLSQRLREETAEAHEAAEHSTFMTDLLSGDLSETAFLALQEQSLLFYTALEQATDALLDDARVAALADPRLRRSPQLRADIAALGGHRAPQALPATADYVAELERIERERDAPALIAHHYVRYLGDLSGGQVIARRMEQNYGIDPTALSFYRFEGIEKLKPFKDDYRQTLDQLELSEAEAAAVVGHASTAFSCNHRVFHGLGDWLSQSSLGV